MTHKSQWHEIYLNKAEKPSVRLSVILLAHLGLPTSTYQLPNITNRSSSYFKFVTRGENWSSTPLKTTAIWLNG